MSIGGCHCNLSLDAVGTRPVVSGRCYQNPASEELSAGCCVRGLPGADYPGFENSLIYGRCLAFPARRLPPAEVPPKGYVLVGTLTSELVALRVPNEAAVIGAVLEAGLVPGLVSLTQYRADRTTGQYTVNSMTIRVLCMKKDALPPASNPDVWRRAWLELYDAARSILRLAGRPVEQADVDAMPPAEGSPPAPARLPVRAL